MTHENIRKCIIEKKFLLRNMYYIKDIEVLFFNIVTRNDLLALH